jgi:peptide/nickel transport system substrate-binding protein
MAEYRGGVTALSTLLLQDGPGKTSQYYTAAQADYYWAAFEKAGLAFAKLVLDDILAAYGKDYNLTDYASAAAFWGYKDIKTEADFWAALKTAYGYDISDNGINYEKTSTSIGDMITKELGDKADEYAKGIQVGTSAANIAGIEKTGEYSLKVTMNKYDATSIYQLALTVAPLHYYGSEDAYDYAANKFGFTKGDLAGVRAKTTKPLGAGPYAFINYENGIIHYERNEYYFKGAPKIKYLNFQETDAGNKFAGVSAGTFDITDPNFDTATVDAIKEASEKFGTSYIELHDIDKMSGHPTTKGMAQICEQVLAGVRG